MSKILIVDDDKDATNLLEKIVRADGHEAVVVNDSSQAMKAAGASAPDLILLDLMMPEPNGFELCKMLRREARFEKTPILIVTAMDNSDSRAIALVAGANDYISKPFNNEELSERIQQMLKGA